MNELINIPEYQVSQFNRLFRDVIEKNFSYVRIKGEISEIKRATRGQLYLTLKDDESILSGVIWDNKKRDLQYNPEAGMEVVVTGKITPWSKFKTSYQVDIDKVELAGEGALLKLIEDRKQRLKAKGIFDTKHKRTLPFLPNKIGVITSPTGSVIHDIINRIQDRFPTNIDVWPVAVQGHDAAETIINAIKGFNSVIFQDKPDVIIIARGGGSTEDLMAFNDEELAEVVFKSVIPIISAIGHEPDINIIDYVADISLATPSHAAKKVVPERSELLLRVKNIFKNFENNYSHFFTNKIKNLDYYFSKLQKPDVLFNFKKESFFKNKVKFFNSEKKFFQLLNDKLKNIVGKFDIGSHQNILKRGYAYIKNLKDNSFIKSAKNIEEKTNLTITFHDGSIEAISKKK